MTDVVTYYSQNHTDAREAWAAYAIMPNGRRWNVVAFGETEAEASEKIDRLWNSERTRLGFNGAVFSAPASPSSPQPEKPLANDPWASPIKPQHHLAGMMWLIHKVNRNKARVSAAVGEQMLATGEWERGGPRSK